MNPTMVMPKIRQIQLKHGNQINYVYTDLLDKELVTIWATGMLSKNIQEVVDLLKKQFPKNIILTEAQFNKFTNKIKTF